MKYTTVDLTEIQYSLDVNAKDYIKIKDLEEFILGLALGLIEVEELLVSDKFSKIDEQEILEINEDIKIQRIKDLALRVKKNRELESNNENLEDITEVSNKESKKENDDNMVTTVERDNIKQEDNKKEKIVEVETDGKTSLFGKIFRGRKSKDLTPVEIDIGNSIENMLREDYTRGKYFKKMIVDEGYLTEEEVAKVEKIIEEHRRLGETKYFIQVCRERKILSETECAKLLTKGTTTEILCKDVLETQIELIASYNTELYAITDKYFIIDVDYEKNTVTVCKDLIEQPNTYYLEKLYPGYEVIVKNVIEGVTKEMHHLITLHQVR